VSADPLAVHAPGEADFNLYAYVSGAVLKNTDPIGLTDEGGYRARAQSKVGPKLREREHVVTLDEVFISNTGGSSFPRLPNQPDRSGAERYEPQSAVHVRIAMVRRNCTPRSSRVLRKATTVESLGPEQWRQF